MNVGLPAALDHAPLGPVAVHGDDHAPAARGDAVVAVGSAVERLEQLLEGVDVVEGAGLGHVAPVEEHVDAHLLHLLLVAAAQQGEEVLDVAVHVSVRQQPEEVEALGTLAGALRQRLPDLARLALEDRPGLDRLLHQLGALVEDAAGAEGVVTHLAVAHVVVRGHADGLAVGQQPGAGRVGGEPVEVRRAREPHGVGVVALADAHAVHDADHDGPVHTGKASVPLQPELVAAHRPSAADHSRGRAQAGALESSKAGYMKRFASFSRNCV